jgi:hypothetical protein
MARTRPGILGREAERRAANVRSGTMKRRLALLFGVAALAALVAVRTRRTRVPVARPSDQEAPKPLWPRATPEARLPAQQGPATHPRARAAEESPGGSPAGLEAPARPAEGPPAQAESRPPATTVAVLDPAADAAPAPPLAAPRWLSPSAPDPVSPPLPPRTVTDVNGHAGDSAFLGALPEVSAPARRRRRRFFPRRGRARDGLGTWLPTVIAGGALFTTVILLVVSGTLDGAIDVVSSWFALF